MWMLAFLVLGNSSKSFYRADELAKARKQASCEQTTDLELKNIPSPQIAETVFLSQRAPNCSGSQYVET